MNNVRYLVLMTALVFLFMGCPDPEPDPVDDDDDVTIEEVICETPADAGGFSYSYVPTWRDDSTAAYSMVHDDLCDWGVRGIQQNAVPALADRGLAAALATIASECEISSAWDVVENAEELGMEIANHSYEHSAVTPENASLEINDAKALLEQHTVNPVTFYVYPYDYFTPETSALVEAAGHLGARGGDRDDNDGFDNPPVNTPEAGPDYEVEFDVWPRTYSKYALYYPEDILMVHIWNAIDEGGWAVREFHSVIEDGEPEEDNGFGPIYMSDYENHLDELVDAFRKGILWTAPPSEVIKYRHAREACGASVSGDSLEYDTSNPECTTYATPISVVVTTATDVASVQGQRGEDDYVLTRKLSANTFSITADPTLGSVALTGCADAGPTVATGDISPRPVPADSVCDIETVVGSGSPGNMDDLERDPEEFQVLPNPSQADGRDGSWSWYPQDATVEMWDDGGNTVLHYAGTNLNAWTGVTLAFLGGNGAGTCYDAGAYLGLQFDIMGTVNSADELAGQVIVSMVTAETQSQTYGGDLDGQGGHFNAILPLSESWETVTITWEELNAPTWGASMGFPDLALGEMQAIDWGVTDQATDFEIYIDNVELF